MITSKGRDVTLFRFLKKKLCEHSWNEVGNENYIDFRGDATVQIVLYCPLCSERKEFSKEEAEIQLNISKVRSEFIRADGQDI